jgi:hypothetical protein
MLPRTGTVVQRRGARRYVGKSQVLPPRIGFLERPWRVNIGRNRDLDSVRCL